MNFKDFYTTTEARLTEAIISLWATGDADAQRYFTMLLEKEGLLAEPVFQTAFPWEPAAVDFGSLTDLFQRDFINALDRVRNSDYRFPKDRKPYKHQVESWQTLLNTKKSIAVTTGTGSGKTECFMLPVLYDIYTNCRNKQGVNALFLYPLNALIGSQKKRIDTWCRALGGIRYAVYNGQTLEHAPSKSEIEKFPEMISRKQIRDTPPQILFTNPAMLEYMLVRNKDVPLLNNSRGTLRWILLDEAHTLTGSSAAEMALLIRRVIDAFHVKASDLRFAITSATVGSGAESVEHLKKFMANLCGIEEEQIIVVTGNRVETQSLDKPQTNIANTSIIDHPNPTQILEVQTLRKDLLKKSYKLSELGERLGLNSHLDILSAIDQLSENQIEGKSILPVRGHFFARGIGGVFICTAPGCKRHQGIKPLGAQGSLTTIAGTFCECGGLLLELVSCRSCGNQFIESERTIIAGNEKLSLVSNVVQDPFTIDRPEEDDEEDRPLVISNRFYFTKHIPESRYFGPGAFFSLSNIGEKITGEQYYEAGGDCCPHCGEDASNPLHFRISSSFINRVLADILLEHTPEADVKFPHTLWNGHKYISFTDSRQGTAKISALINQDNEANWVRSQVFHRLWEIANEGNTGALPPAEASEMLEDYTRQFEQEKHPFKRIQLEKTIAQLQADIVGAVASNAELDWDSLKDFLARKQSFNTLYFGNNSGDTNPHGKRGYLGAILYDQFARRLPRERSLENLGMVSLIYPKINTAALPSSATNLGISLDEWKMLLKIAADYIIRSAFHISLNPEIYPYTTAFLYSRAIFPSNTTVVGVKKWPIFERKLVQNRLALLICAGLGYHDLADIDQHLEDQINDLMDDIWRVMVMMMDREDDGFKLNLETQSKFTLLVSTWLCPVKKRLIDAHFRGYSPWIKGKLTEENIRHYRIEKEIAIPNFPYPFNQNALKEPDLQTTKKWIRNDTIEMRRAGVWNNLHERVILNRPLYLSGEHSAQQNAERLETLEREFEESKINILNCSTTMEMGVDIGGVSAVVMNNVPPSPANYLQRAGRAGRRSESKSLAFTICAPNPIGLNAMDDPLWALHHPIAPPMLSFNSESVVQRHVNAFLLGKFVQSEVVGGISINMDTERFFIDQAIPMALLFQSWLNDSSRASIYAKQIAFLIDKTPFQGRSASFLINKVSDDFSILVDKTITKNDGYLAKLVEMKTVFTEESPAFRTVLYQHKHFLRKNVIGYLAENGFLPSAGLPIGVVEFDTITIDDIKKKKNSDNRKDKPSYFITRALSEFAPGKQVVIDGKCYESAGIVMENSRGEQAERQIVQSCRHCGYQRTISVANDEDPNSLCPQCQRPELKGIDLGGGVTRTYTELIQPVGFAVDVYRSPTRKIQESSSAHYVDPLLMNIRPWEDQSHSYIDTREGEENAEIFYYNVGAGDGYSICLHCGRAETDPSKMQDHRRLRGGKNSSEDTSNLCTGNQNPWAIRRNVVIGGKFKTDICELRIKDQNGNYISERGFLYTLGAVLSKLLSQYLAIEEAEISFGVKNYENFSTIFIFDTAKGGAGYSSQFNNYIAVLLRQAQTLLNHCGCEKACTKCLIDRNTQWSLDRLDKGPVLEWLAFMVNREIPLQLANQYPGLEFLHGSIQPEISRMRYHNKIRTLRLYGVGEAGTWAFDELPWLRKMSEMAKVELSLHRLPESMTPQEKLTLIQTGTFAQLKTFDPNDEELLKIICKIETDQGEVVTYLARDFDPIFAKQWGLVPDGQIFRQKETTLEILPDIILEIDKQSMAEAYLTSSSKMQSEGIADLVIEAFREKIDLNELMRGREFQIRYADRYLKTPFGCLLMVQFVRALSSRLGFGIRSLRYEGIDFNENWTPRFIYNNFKDATARNRKLEMLIEEIGVDRAEVVNTDPPHYRFFEFIDGELKITIRPDAGIEHGWFVDHGVDKNYHASLSAAQSIPIKRAHSAKPLLYTLSIDKNTAS